MNISNINNNSYMTKTETDTSKARLSSAAAGNTVDAFEKAISGVSVSFGDDNGRLYDNIRDGISSVEEDLRSDAQLAKDNLKALFNKLSGADAIAMDKDGFDLNDVDDEELVGVVERIKIMLAAYNTNYQKFDGAFDTADEEDVENSGDIAVKAAARLAASDIPATQDNAAEVTGAVMMAQDVSGQLPLSDDAKAYMIDNNYEPTIGNIYKALHSVGVSAGRYAADNESSSALDMQWQQVKPQVGRIIENAGLKDTEDTFENARWLMNRDLPVTADNIVMKGKLDSLDIDTDEDKLINAAVDAMVGGEKAFDINTSGDTAPWKQVGKAIDVLSEVTFADVCDMTQANRQFTIEEMQHMLDEKKSANEYGVAKYNAGLDTEKPYAKDGVTQPLIDVEGKAASSDEASTAAVENYRVLLEARVLMTSSSVVSIINQGIDIYSEDLHNLVDMLHAGEANYLAENLNSSKYGKVSAEDLNSTVSISDLMEGLRFSPAAAIGNMLAIKTTLTVTSVTETAFSVRARYEQAGEAYELMSTKVRSDMGDSVKAAVSSSAESILSGLGMENNADNRRAVRILAYNGMEATRENVEDVRSIDSMISNLMDNMTPQTVLNMIQDDVNPLNTNIEVLNNYINENYANSEPTVKYSEFLYKLDSAGAISEDERKQFIGVYKMFHQLKKDGGKAAGALLAQGSDVTLGNLVTFMESRKKYGMDVSLDENAGRAEVVGNVSYFQNLFSSLSRTITPQALKKAADETGSLEDMSIQQLGELMEEYEDADADAKLEYYNEMLDNARQYQNVEDDVIRLMTDTDIPVTFYNVMAAQRLCGKNERYGGRYFEDCKNVRNDRLDTAVSDIIDLFDGKDEAEDAVRRVQDALAETVDTIMESDASDTYQDINNLKLLGKTAMFMTQLSKRSEYFIPFEDGGEISGINLKLVKGGDDNGQLEMRFETAGLGNVYAKFSVGTEGMSGYFVTDSAEGVKRLRENVDNISKGLKRLGITDTEISVSQGKEIPVLTHSDNETDTPTELIYKAAKEILKAM